MLHGWPGNSPDLNPIENCWFILKNKAAELNPTSYKDVVDKVKSVWLQQMTVDYCNRLVESMARRIQTVLVVKGGCTKY